MDKIFQRVCKGLTYTTPEGLLTEIMADAEVLLRSQGSCGFSSARRKHILETLQAGYLGFMVKHISGVHAEVTVAVKELDDFDCVLKGIAEGQTVYRPVQLKQIPPKEFNPGDVSLDQILDDLKKYTSSPELIISIWINRDILIDLSEINVSGLTIQQLWIVGDRPDGAVEIHGGTIADWLEGLCWEGTMHKGRPSVRQIRFCTRARTRG